MPLTEDEMPMLCIRCCVNIPHMGRVFCDACLVAKIDRLDQLLQAEYLADVEWERARARRQIFERTGKEE